MSPPILFCPRCAQAMGRVDGRLTCERGRMPLSPSLEHDLLERFGACVAVDAAEPRAGALYYCPACRIPLDDALACPECRGSLFDLRFTLVDLHPHYPYDRP